MPPASVPNSLTRSVWIVLIIIILVWGGYWVWVAPHFTESKFDPLNALFSGLAFLGVIYAILLQKSELALQRKELELTRNEVRGQKEQLEAQNAMLKKQNFENTFFSLIDLYISIVNALEIRLPQLGIPHRDVTFKGRECFSNFFSDLKREYDGERKRAPDSDDLALCKSAYGRFANYRQSDIGHYFSTLYKIIQFVDSSEIEEKQIYINLLKAQLSSYELSLLFYNCLSEYSMKYFKLYVEKCGLLEHLSLLLAPGHKELLRSQQLRQRLSVCCAIKQGICGSICCSSYCLLSIYRIGIHRSYFLHESYLVFREHCTFADHDFRAFCFPPLGFS